MENKRSNRGQWHNNDSATCRGIGPSYQPMRNTESKSDRGSHSTLNRILSNIERSILNQFNNTSNHNDKCRHNSTQKQTPSAKVQQAINVNPKATTSTSGKEHGIANVRDSNGSKSIKHQISNQEQTTCKDRISSSTLKASVIKSASEKLGKLTLNSKSQQHKSPRQHQQLLPSSSHPNMNNQATNKTPIPPPPHAHSDARNLNQTFLFGSEPAQMVLDTNDRLLLDTASAKVNASYSPQKEQNGTSKMRSDKVFEELHANRTSSSPASSAKSLPTIAPKSGSQSNNLVKTTAQDDEEDSGFASYRSRRETFLKSQHQQQQQLEFPQATNGDRSIMMYHPANPSPDFYTNATVQNPLNHQIQDFRKRSNMVPNNMIINNNNQLSFMLMPQANQHQFTLPHMIPQNDQMSQRDCNNLPYFIHNQPAQQSNISYSQTCESQQAQGMVPFQQVSYINQRLGPQRNLNQQISTDSGQQIYANAPPKPRRYQYYGMTADQNPGPMGQVAGFNMMPSMQQHHGTTTIRYLPNHQPSYHPQRQFVMPQLPYQRVIAGAPSLNNLSRLNSSNNMITRSNQPTHNLNGVQIRHPNQDPLVGQLVGFPLVKSKSSLDASDITRFRQGPQPSNQNASKFQSQPKQPFHGYQNSSTMLRSQNQPTMRPLSYDQSQPNFTGGNLQRSKSVTHLLPDLDERVPQNQAPISAQRISVSSASTNHLNYIGLNQTIAQPMTHGRLNQTNGFGNRPLIQQLHQMHTSTQRNQTTNHCGELNLLPQITNANSFANQPQFHRARSVAALNSENALPNRFIRCSPGNVSYEQRSANKPSLGDQIRHLLIDGADNSSARAIGPTNQDDNAVYQAFEHKRSFGIVPPSSNASSFLQASTAWAESNGDRLKASAKVSQQQSQQNESHILSSNPPAPENEDFHNIRNSSNENPARNNPVSHNLPNRSQISTSSLSLAELNELADMGNRHQRQYQVQQTTNADMRNRAINFARRPSDTNSHLIVDLTTPKVLAKTQTTLQSTNHSIEHSADSWSINQVGLPQMSTPTSISSAASVQNTGRPSYFTTDLHNKPGQHEKADHRGPILVDKSTNTTSPSLGNTAPYYYSDLKSEEQRQALMSIVQQKSLSPPPQLLSRSVDQSATRLTPRSATMHSSHARTWSDGLAQRRRERDHLPDSRDATDAAVTSKKDQSQVADSNSVSTNAEKIDKPVSVSVKILDIEARCQSVAQQVSRLDNKTNPFSDNFTGDIQNGQRSEEATVIDRHKQGDAYKSMDDDDDDSSRDDDDFIEFPSNDSSSHRSTFEASQFSASDFNTSTSTSESSNSCGAIGDSLNSMLSCKKDGANKISGKSNGFNSSITLGILKSNDRSCSFDGGLFESDNNNHISNDCQPTKDAASDKNLRSPTLCDVKIANGTRSKGVEKFKNVLGNVVDVDSCSVNNLSGTSPVNNHQTPCLS